MEPKLGWANVQAIAVRLAHAHPDLDPLSVRFADLDRWVRELPGFEGESKGNDDKVLEAIQMAWVDEVTS